MNRSFHYFGTYCAAYIAGYSHTESLEICYCAELVDKCSRTFLKRIDAPLSAATTQLPGEMAKVRTNVRGLADITRIWASFHFLPFDLYAPVNKGGKRYKNKYRMICGPNGDLVTETVNLARGKDTQAAGLAMHVLADTWAHRYFAGTPSLVINNTNRYFFELLPKAGSSKADEAEGFDGRPIKFKHNPKADDDLEAGVYTNTVFQPNENNVMNLGHGRAGHLPDYSFARYRYVPAWNNYEEIVKDNPHEYYLAFCQMVYALECLRTTNGQFQLDTYATKAVAPHEQQLRHILEKRQDAAGACADWRAFAKELSGKTIPDFDLDAHVPEYLGAGKETRSSTFLGKFVLAALAQKGMVVNRVHSSGNPLAGRSIRYDEKGYAGIKDFFPLVGYLSGGDNNG